jgi:uncharacterized membrane protein
MGKLEYLDALKRAMAGLPPETQAKTLAFYEQRFVDGVAAGRSEADVGRELDDPKKIAMTLRASAHLSTLSEKTHPASVVRMLVTAVGLAIFNLFMVVPAAVFGALLTALYACSLAFYASGVVVTASGLAGANEYVFKQPVHRIVIDGDEDPGRGRQENIMIGGPHGIVIHAEDDGAPGLTVERMDGKDLVREYSGNGRIRISTDMDENSRSAQIATGIGLVLAGIVLSLLALVITRFTFIGIKRYLQMNLSLLKGS